MPLKVPNFAQLSERVYLVLGLNPGTFTLQGTNTYIVGTGRSRILLHPDTGQGIPAYQQNLQDCMRKIGAESLSAIICTHRHHDHIGGVHQVQELYPTAPVYKRRTNSDMASDALEFKHLEDGQKFEVEGATLVSLYTPGHLDDHVALRLDEENAIFSGDCVLGEGTTVFDDLKRYLQSLQRLRDMRPSLIYPGHGPIVDRPLDAIQHYISHRQEREDQILKLLQSTANGAAVNTLSLAKQIYKDAPERLIQAGEKLIQLHLDKLMEDGRATKVTEGWVVQPST
ncbi:beta-lactamase-like protein 2-like protein [Phlyctochytrium arcticum]|nr:beta-lactamase-like protein 2-like protein [Phlyctochytrium arcticum]